MTDKAQSPPVRPNNHEITQIASEKYHLAVERRATNATPLGRQQTHPAYYQTTQNGDHLSASMQAQFDRYLQKGRYENKSHSSGRSTGRDARPDRQRPSRQEQGSGEVRQMMAKAARERQDLALLKQQLLLANKRHAEQEALNNPAAARARSSTSRLPKRATTANPHAQPAVPVASRPRPVKKPVTILDRIGADAQKARNQKIRELKVRNEQTREPADDTSDYRAQREAESNHALSVPVPYQSIRTVSANVTKYDAKPQTTAEDELILEPSTPRLPHGLPAGNHVTTTGTSRTDQTRGPFSLNSAAGVEAIQKSIPRPVVTPYDVEPSTTTATQRFMNTKPKEFLKKTKGPSLLPITANDLQLYKWRAENLKWSEVLQLYGDLPNRTINNREETLRARFRQTAPVIEREDVSTELCQQVIDGDAAAEQELNRLVSLQAPEVVNLEVTPFKKMEKQERLKSVPAVNTPAPHPAQAGKKLDSEFYMLSLGYAKDVWCESSDSEDEDKDSARGSPLCEADYVHWEYFIERRDIVAEDRDDERENLDDEFPWREYNHSFGTAGEANAESAKFIFAVPEGGPKIFVPGEKFGLDHDPYSEGMVVWSLESEHGLIQVRTNRRLLTFQDHIMPDHKQTWLSKTMFAVFIKKVKKGDDLFNAPEFSYNALNNHIYGCLDQANSVAMDEWLKLTLKPATIHLDERARIREEAKQALQRQIEDDGEAKREFSRVMDDEERMIEVSVQAMDVKGPRN